MSRVRGRDTIPEKIVRSLLHRDGFRFSLHRKDLPGKPDIILPRYQVIVFVHGCFWHRHKGCAETAMPKTRTSFWRKKFDDTVARDAKVQRRLRRLGWRVKIVWTCRIGDKNKLTLSLSRFLRRPRKSSA